MRKTLRLMMPQWQGGDNPAYAFGAKLLEWLAPSTGDAYRAEVPVEPYDGGELPKEGGVLGRSAALRQLNAAAKIIEAYSPKRIIVFGGDCLVSQAPFAYLNELYGGEMGVLWLDSHPDVFTPELFYHEHAMVLGNLLGEGDPAFSACVRVPVKPGLVMFGGLQEITEGEAAIIERLDIRRTDATALAKDSSAVLEWIRDKDIRCLAVHLDLDVLDPKLFRSLQYAMPEGAVIPLGTRPDGTVIESPSGEMTLAQVSRLIGDVARQTDIVGLSIAEYTPWDAIDLREFLCSLPIFG